MTMTIGLWIEQKLQTDDRSVTWLCQNMGVGQATVSNWKTGKFNPNLEMMKRVVNFLADRLNLDRKELWLEILELE
jgi:predicted transcriptional regulator